MQKTKFILLSLFFLTLFSGCQTIKQKTDAIIEKENTKLKEDLVNIKKKLAEKNKKIRDNKIESKNLEFLTLNLLHGHKCRKTMFRSKLYKIGTDEYRACVLSKGPIKSN